MAGRVFGLSFFLYICAASLVFAQNRMPAAKAGPEAAGCKAKIRWARPFTRSKFHPDIILPRVALANRTAERKINKFLNLERLTDYSRNAILKEIKDAEASRTYSQGLVATDFEVNYNAHCLLSLTVTNEYMGAYPSSATDYFTFDLQTGELVSVKDIFKLESLPQVIYFCDSILNMNIRAMKEEAMRDSSGCAELLGDENVMDTSFGINYHEHRFREKDLEKFFIKEDTLVFVYVFDWVHAAKACEPDGEIPLPISRLKPYLKEGWPGSE